MRPLRRVLVGVTLAGVLVPIVTGAQPSTVRRAVNLASLSTYPGFYHQRLIVTVGTLALGGAGQLTIGDGERSLIVVASGSADVGPREVRGQFWDLGRMNADDPRLAQYDLRRTFHIDPEGAWPRPGQVLAVVDAAVAPAGPPGDATIRGLVLFPSRYQDQPVTIRGQFAGRNLLGDLPDSPSNSRWDFVMRAADAAVWVSNIRPRGRDFELSLDARVDTGRWIEVTGTLQQARGLQWIDAAADSLRIVPAPADTELDEPIRVPLGPPPEVVFSAPVGGEIEVSPATNVRIQFSRDIDPTTFRNRIIVSYLGAGEGAVPDFTTQYRAGNRVLEIAFAEPLQPFRTVKVELTDGVLGIDKQGLPAWSLEFETGR